MGIRWVKQETRNSCGPSCVAIVAGVSWEEGVKACHRNGRTNYPHLKRGLDALGVKYGQVTRYKRGMALPPTAIVLLRWGERIGHFVVHDNGVFLDPSVGVLLWEDYPDDYRITSFLPIEGRR